MNDSGKMEIQVKAATFLAEHTLNEMTQIRSSLMKEYVGVSSIKEFNKLDDNCVKIINGKIMYDKELILKSFAEFYAGFLTVVTNDNQKVNVFEFIKSMFQVVKNTRITVTNIRISRELDKVHKKYSTTEGNKNLYQRLSEEKDELLLLLNDVDPEDIEFYGGIESYTKELLTETSVDKILSDFKEDMKKLEALLEKKNKLFNK